MTIEERVELLTNVVSKFPELGDFGDRAALMELVRLELPEGFVPPKQILHIISANTAMAGMQSLVRGLILGSINWCKIPGVGLPRFEEFVEQLPYSLRCLVEVSPVLNEGWQENAEAIVVFGNDDTVEKFRSASRSNQIFIGYGNRWSGAVIYSDPDFSSIPHLINDICLYQQMGCLSAQIIWLHESVDTIEYGKRLAAEMKRYISPSALSTLDFQEAASVARWRLSAEWKAVHNEKNRVWLSSGEPVWGVLLNDMGEEPGLSCLHRHVTLQIFSDFPQLGRLSESVSTLGIWPRSAQNLLEGLSASRICEVGEMQFPKPTWQQDGFPALGRLVRK